MIRNADTYNRLAIGHSLLNDNRPLFTSTSHLLPMTNITGSSNNLTFAFAFFTSRQCHSMSIWSNTSVEGKECPYVICNCCMNPGASILLTTLAPRPPQELQVTISSADLAPVPSHWSQMTCLDISTSIVVPRYRSRSSSSRGIVTSG